MTESRAQFTFIQPDLGRLTLFLFLTIFYYAAPWRQGAVTALAVGAPFIIIYTMLIPGLALRRVLFPSLNVPAGRIAISLFSGMGYLLCVAFVWAANGGSLAGFTKALSLLLLPALLLPLAVRFEQRKEEAPGSTTPPRNLGAQILLLVIAIAICAHVYVSGPPLDYTKDTLDHLGYVEEIRETGEFFPTGAVYADAGVNGNDLRKGVLHYLYGFFCEYLGVDTLTGLRIINAYLALLMVAGIFAAAMLCFGNARIAVTAAIIFIAAAGGGLAHPVLRESLYTNRFGLIFYLLFIATAMRHLEAPRWRRIAALWLWTFAAAAVHVLYGILIGIAVVVTLLWKICFPQLNRRTHFLRTISIGTTALFGIAPYLLYRFLTASQETNTIHTEIQGVVFVTAALYFAEPVKLIKWFSLPGLLSCCTVIPLWRIRRNHAALGFMIATVLTLPLVMLNPVVLPFLYEAMGYLVTRMMYLAPFYLLAAYFLATVFARGKKIPVGTGSLLLALILLAALAGNGVQVYRTGALTRAAVEREQARSYLRWDEQLAAAAEQLPDSAVIASDPVTSYSVSAVTPFAVVSTLDQHAPPNDLKLTERNRLSRDILSPYVPLSATTGMLGAAGADYIIVNGRISDRLQLHYYSLVPELVPRIREKFLSRPELFATILDREDFLVVRWNGVISPVKTPTVRPPVFRSIPGGFKRAGAGLNAGLAVLAGYRLSSSAVRRGEILEIKLLWMTERTLPMRNYAVTIRLDKIEQDLPYDGKPFPKLSRKIMERLNGERYRCRFDHKLAGGFLSPDVWPPGRYVMDETRLPIPADLSPGRYTLSVILLDLPNMTTYRLRDLLYDDDMYQGPAIAELSVK